MSSRARCKGRLTGLKIKAQISMVLNLDKCIGCHTCSITCKNVWTNREGAEYMYFNNVETKPGIGYPKNWEDQEKWKGGWKLGKDGKLALRTGSKPERLLKLFYHRTSRRWMITMSRGRMTTRR